MVFTDGFKGLLPRSTCVTRKQAYMAAPVDPKGPCRCYDCMVQNARLKAHWSRMAKDHLEQTQVALGMKQPSVDFPRPRDRVQGIIRLG